MLQGFQQLVFVELIFFGRYRGVLTHYLLTRRIVIEIIENDGFDDGVNLDGKRAFRLRFGHFG